MKKKILLSLSVVLCALCCAFGLAACGGVAPKVDGLLVANVGEQPKFTEDPTVSTGITYGEKPNLKFYNLYLHYDNGKIVEIPTDYEKLTAEYSYSVSGKRTTIEELPDEFLVGLYTIEYTYDGNAENKATVNFIVSRAQSGAFTVHPTVATWDTVDNTPNVTVKNPKGQPVIREESASAQQNIDDTNGTYYLHYIKKPAYDGFTDAQKTDYDFIMNFISEDADKPEHEAGKFSPDTAQGMDAGEYMLFAEVYSTFNYWHVITPAVPITVTEPIVGRTFTFQDIVAKDGEGHTLTDTNDEDYGDYVEMAIDMRAANADKTVVCTTDYELRGTVDFGAGVFDELEDKDVYKYTADGKEIDIYTFTGDFVGDGKLSGDTFSVKMNIGGGYYFLITFTRNAV